MAGLVGELKSKIGARHIISRHINRGFASRELIDAPRLTNAYYDSLTKEASISQNISSLTDYDYLVNDIDKKTREILNSPMITGTDSQFDKAFNLFKYVITNSTYDENVLQEKSKEDIREPLSFYKMQVRDLHRCLCENRGVCSSDAITLSYLFSCIGINSSHLTIADKALEHIHQIVKFELNGKEYFCDATLVRSAFEKGAIPNIDKQIFALSRDVMFGKLHPNSEIRAEFPSMDLHTLKDPILFELKTNSSFATSQDAQKRLEREEAQRRLDDLNVFEDGKRNSNETLQTPTEISNDKLEDVTPKTNNVSKSQMLRNEDFSK